MCSEMKGLDKDKALHFKIRYQKDCHITNFPLCVL